jgi:hypothetical protein
MQGTFHKGVEEQREIERQLRQGDDKIVSCRFGVVAKALWPFKTAAHLAAIAGRDERTASRWLSGEYEPPNIIILAILTEIVPKR